MASYDQKIRVRVAFEKDARHFLAFLQRVGARYSRPVRLNYRYLKRGYFYLVIDGGSGGIDALFQELILNRGLYYYTCTLAHRKAVIVNVIMPVYRQLVDERFQNPQSRFLRKHILGKRAQTDFVPTEIRNADGSAFEILFRKWDLGMISNKDYLISLDALLTGFLLKQAKHEPGRPSAKFNVVLDGVADAIVIDKEMKETFARIHELSRKALHRLSGAETSDELNALSTKLFQYFTYFDDFVDSQKEKSIVLRGKRYRRIRYGDEQVPEDIAQDLLREQGVSPGEFARTHPCGDCGVRKGQLHVEGCDIEICPRCGGQYISSECGVPR
jgi:hypothetical protein